MQRKNKRKHVFNKRSNVSMNLASLLKIIRRINYVCKINDSPSEINSVLNKSIQINANTFMSCVDLWSCVEKVYLLLPHEKHAKLIQEVFCGAWRYFRLLVLNVLELVKRMTPPPTSLWAEFWPIRHSRTGIPLVFISQGGASATECV